MQQEAPGAHRTFAATELILAPVGTRRLAHSLAYQAPLRFASRMGNVGVEVALGRLRDAVLARRLQESQVLRSEEGGAPAATEGRRIALYLHYAASGRISPMIRLQLATYRALGFDVMFATNSEQVDEADWRAVAPHCWRLISRRNLGFDFGAWRDSAALLLADYPVPDELLLVNDSVIGPIYPLGPLLSHARMLGTGAVGLTESWQGGVHLQSYFMLVLGRAAVADTLEFLFRLRLSTSKWLMVQRGEFGLTLHLVRRGHQVAALFGYVRALDALLACPEEARYLVTLARQLPRNTTALQDMRTILLRWPLNPTIHLWRGLPQCLGFPFLKVALLRQNPMRLPGIAAWPTLLEKSILAPDLVSDHLAQISHQ